MKKLFIVFSFLSLCLLSWAQSEKFEFPFYPNSPEWDKYETPGDRVKALQIPQALLSSIPTNELLKICLDFPYLSDFLLSESYDKGLNGLAFEFNGFSELLKRKDLAKALLTKIRNLKQDFIELPDIDIEKGRFSIQNMLVEYMLSTGTIRYQLSSEEKASLLEILQANKLTKDHHKNVFGRCNKNISQMVIDKLLSSSYSQFPAKYTNDPNFTPANIYTPFGSLVSDTYTFIGDDIEYGTNEYVYILNDLYTNYNGIEIVDGPTYTYNCHAYAFHVINGYERVWLGKEFEYTEDLYWQDGSYMEVPESLSTVVSYFGNHSAVRLTDNLYISKWGLGFLVKHTPNNVPPYYLPNSTKRYFKPAMRILGANVVCDSVTYSVSNLQNNMSVTWELKNGTFSSNSNMFKPNYPSSNLCMIKANTLYGCTDTLLAHIYVGTIKTVTYSLPIRTLSRFCCNLAVTQSLPGFSYMPPYAYDGNTIGVPADAPVTLTSPSINNMSINHSGLNPNYFTVNHNTGEIKFSIPSIAQGQYLTITGDAYDNCEHFNIRFRIGTNRPIIEPIDPPIIFVGIGDGGDEPGGDITGQLSINTWNLQVYQVTTGKIVFNQQIKTKNTKVDTGKWDTGLYVFKIIVNGETFSKTIKI